MHFLPLSSGKQMEMVNLLAFACWLEVDGWEFSLPTDRFLHYFKGRIVKAASGLCDGKVWHQIVQHVASLITSWREPLAPGLLG